MRNKIKIIVRKPVNRNIAIQVSSGNKLPVSACQVHFSDEESSDSESESDAFFSFSPITSDDEDSDLHHRRYVIHSDLEEEDSDKEEEAIMELCSLENYSE